MCVFLLNNRQICSKQKQITTVTTHVLKVIRFYCYVIRQVKNVCHHVKWLPCLSFSLLLSIPAELFLKTLQWPSLSVKAISGVSCALYCWEIDYYTFRSTNVSKMCCRTTQTPDRLSKVFQSDSRGFACLEMSPPPSHAYEIYLYVQNGDQDTDVSRIWSLHSLYSRTSKGPTRLHYVVSLFFCFPRLLSNP